MQQFYRKLVLAISIFHIVSNCFCVTISIAFIESPGRSRSSPVNCCRLQCNRIQRNVRKRVSKVKLNSVKLFSSPPLIAGINHYKSEEPIDSDSISKSDGSYRVLSNTSINDNTDIYDKQAGEEKEEVLSCRIVGFYPFPSYTRTGPLAWLFRDTHQAIIVRTSASNEKVMMDFMTDGGQNHPVWWDEQVKWNVIFGGIIRGEVRVRYTPQKTPLIEPSEMKLNHASKIERLMETARAYNCDMNIYGNNCRMFCARMEREVTRLNAESETIMEDDSSDIDRNVILAGHPHNLRLAKPQVAPPDYVADGLLVWRIFYAGLLPALYPLLILWVCWDFWYP